MFNHFIELYKIYYLENYKGFINFFTAPKNMDELAITCSQESICVWQLRSGSLLQNFKNSVSSRFCVCPPGHLLSPQENKSYLHSYDWNKVCFIVF